MLIAGLQYLIFRVGGLEPLVDVAGETNAVVAGLAFAIGLFFTIFGLNVVQAAAAVAIVELDEGREITALGAYRRVLHRLPGLLLALLGAVVVITAPQPHRRGDPASPRSCSSAGRSSARQ